MHNRFGFVSIFIMAILAVFITPAFAGNLVAMHGKVSWSSTVCAKPSAPASLPTNAETPASTMNAYVDALNDYIRATQAYMDCLVAEAQYDASVASQGVINSAQSMIDSAKKKAAEVGENLKQKASP